MNKKNKKQKKLDWEIPKLVDLINGLSRGVCANGSSAGGSVCETGTTALTCGLGSSG